MRDRHHNAVQKAFEEIKKDLSSKTDALHWLIGYALVVAIYELTDAVRELGKKD